MRQDLDDALCRDFPLLYRDRGLDKSQTCMAWGFPGDGWEPLIRRLSERLEAAIATQPEGDRAVAFQVKEKFGMLRFSLHDGTDEMHVWVNSAESESAGICEDCGAPGRLVGKHWMRTLCPEHTK